MAWTRRHTPSAMDIVDERGLAVVDVGNDGDVAQGVGRDRVVVGLGLRGRGHELPECGASPHPFSRGYSCGRAIFCYAP